MGTVLLKSQAPPFSSPPQGGGDAADTKCPSAEGAGLAE